MIELKLPNITGRTPEEQIQELKRYLYQLVQELNWALETLEKQSGSGEG